MYRRPPDQPLFMKVMIARTRAIMRRIRIGTVMKFSLEPALVHSVLKLESGHEQSDDRWNIKVFQATGRKIRPDDDRFCPVP
jgi:hypothetical protein